MILHNPVNCIGLKYVIISIHVILNLPVLMHIRVSGPSKMYESASQKILKLVANDIKDVNLL
jgi:hypothetical protein